MGSRFSFILLPVLALGAVLVGESTLARQGEAEDSLPGVVIETLGRGGVGVESGEELVLLRVTIEPGASIPASDGPAPPLSSSRRAASASSSNVPQLRRASPWWAAMGPWRYLRAPKRSLRLAMRSPPVKEHVWRCAMPVIARRFCFSRRWPGQGIHSLPPRPRMPPRRSASRPSPVRRSDPGHAGNGRMRAVGRATRAVESRQRTV